MKVSLDPMPALRAATAFKVNEWFDKQAQPHRETAWSLKREAAKAGAPYPDWFAQEATLRGITADALATLVQSKPDVVGERELHRQKVMTAIDAAKSPADLDTLSKDVTAPLR